VITTAFWEPIGHLEVALRNTLDDRLAVRHHRLGRRDGRSMGINCCRPMPRRVTPLAGTCAFDRLVGLDPARDAWRSRFDIYSAAFASVLGPQEGPPAGYKGD
jgi:hypothetical protein